MCRIPPQGYYQTTETVEYSKKREGGSYVRYQKDFRDISIQR